MLKQLSLPLAISAGLMVLMPIGEKAARAQDYPGCYMVNPRGNVIDLDRYCEYDRAPESRGEANRERTPGQPTPTDDEASQSGEATQQTLEDGTTIITQPNGRTIVILPDGTVRGIPSPQGSGANRRDGATDSMNPSTGNAGEGRVRGTPPTERSGTNRRDRSTDASTPSIEQLSDDTVIRNVPQERRNPEGQSPLIQEDFPPGTEIRLPNGTVIEY